MAFPSSIGTTQDNLAAGWERARQAAGDVKAAAVNLKTLAQAGAPAGTVLSTTALFADRRVRLQAVGQLQGIVAYARAQINNPALDVVAEFNTMVAAIDAVITWVTTNFPKDASNFLLYVTFKPNGEIQDRVFTPAQMAGIIAPLDAVIAAIN